jgi:hypothetical protein
VNQSEGGNTERPKRRITLQGVKAHKKIVWITPSVKTKNLYSALLTKKGKKIVYTSVIKFYRFFIALHPLSVLDPP